MFNKNRSCIEIGSVAMCIVSLHWFNKNRSCIEIQIDQLYFHHQPV